MGWLALIPGPVKRAIVFLIAFAGIFGVGYWKGSSAVHEAWDAADEKARADVAEIALADEQQASRKNARLAAERAKWQEQLEAAKRDLEDIRVALQKTPACPVARTVFRWMPVIRSGEVPVSRPGTAAGGHETPRPDPDPGRSPANPPESVDLRDVAANYELNIVETIEPNRRDLAECIQRYSDHRERVIKFNSELERALR